MYRNIMLIIIIVFLTETILLYSQEEISLSGQWYIKLDPHDLGIEKEWFKERYTDIVQLPGSIQEYGYGEKPSVRTKWVATRYSAFFLEEKYAPYRRDDNFKFPFWLTPKTHYKGVAWFKKEVMIPEDWKNKRIELKLERAHWATTVFIENTLVGSRNSLGTPHCYDLSNLIRPGKNTITIRVDNRILIEDIGPEAHSVTDHTQTNWNGIIGEISLKASSPVFVSDVQIYPDLQSKSAKVKVEITNNTKTRSEGNLIIQAFSVNSEEKQTLNPKQQSYALNANESVTIDINYSMGDNPLLWDEFNPNLYKMIVRIAGNKNIIDSMDVSFGMREFKVMGKQFTINGRPVFLRGTLECCIFPKTGYPPTSKTEWKRIFNIIKEHGLNHTRFHSWCPPKAAFEAADETGIYLQVEASTWARHGAFIGYGAPIDRFVIEESENIMKEYGNHPSFVMHTYGNEPDGFKREEYLREYVSMWKNKDPRRVYSGASGWPVLDENDFQLIQNPRMQLWGEGLYSRINAKLPSTDWDFSDVVQQQGKPLVGHETGCWTVYPNFEEMSKYTGFLRPLNFEIFKDFLEKNHMLNQAEEFLMASGKLQVLCYKADIEGSLRTPEYAGYQMLDLHDFPGQGTALVGILDAFWDSKPYVNSEEFRRFSSNTVPLARMEKMVWKNSEVFSADLEVYHYGKEEIKNAKIKWEITDTLSKIIDSGEMLVNLPIGNNIPAGSVQIDLSDFPSPSKYSLKVKVDKYGYNDWDFWVYPDEVNISREQIIITNELTSEIEEKLNNGAKVLLLINKKVREGKGKEIKVGFSTVFWNTVWTGGQAPHTMGILTDPSHSLFKYFPTEYHSNWQWWDIFQGVQAMIMNDLPSDLSPLIQIIDTPFEARKLGMLFECRVGSGKLITTSIDFRNNISDRLATRQLYYSLLEYMRSSEFDPKISVAPESIRSFYEF